MPATLSLIGTMFVIPRQRSLAIGIWATMFALGMALGPLAGGVLLDYAVKHGADAGVDSRTLVAAAAGTAFAVVFVRRQHRLADPLLDLRLFRVPAFGAALAVLLVALIGVGGAMLLVAQHLQLVEQLSPLAAGLWMGPAALAMFVAAIGAPLLARRIRPAVIVAATLAASSAGYFLLAGVDGPGNIVPVVAAFALIYLGLGAIAALGTDLVVGSAPAHRAGSAAAMSETVQELGIAVDVAVLGSLANCVYRATVLADAAPGLAASASTTLAGAVSADLPPAALDAARHAQTTGLGAVGLVSGTAVAALATLSLVVLRRVGTVGS